MNNALNQIVTNWTFFFYIPAQIHWRVQINTKHIETSHFNSLIIQIPSSNVINPHSPQFAWLYFCFAYGSYMDWQKYKIPKLHHWHQYTEDFVHNYISNRIIYCWIGAILTKIDTQWMDNSPFIVLANINVNCSVWKTCVNTGHGRH